MMTQPNRFFDMVTGVNSAGTDTDSSNDYDENNSTVAVSKNDTDTDNNSDDSANIDDALPSTMPDDARRVLVHLMRYGVIFHSQKPHLYDALCQYQAMIQRHLSEVYLTLILDERQGIAFIARPDSDINSDSSQDNADLSINNDKTDLLANELADSEDSAPSLIIKRTLPLYDTLILLMLRKYYQERESSGEHKIIIDIERLSSLLTPFLPLTDHTSKDLKKLSARLKELSRRHLLSSIQGADERYEITPLIRYVVSADFLESMLEEYLRLAQEMTGESLASPNLESTNSEKEAFDEKYFERDTLNHKATGTAKTKKTVSNNKTIDNQQLNDDTQSDLFGE